MRSLYLIFLFASAFARTHVSRRDISNPFFNFEGLAGLADSFSGLVSGVQKTVDDLTESIAPIDIEREVEIDSRKTIRNPNAEADEVTENKEAINPLPFSSFFPSTSKAWYEGENACLTVEDIDETDHADGDNGRAVTTFSGSFTSSYSGNGQMFSKSCALNEEEYACKIQEIKNGVKKTRIEKRRCCYGFKRQGPNGMCKEMDLKNMVQTLRDVECESFVNMSQSARINNILTDKNLTVFCPNDEALEDFQREIDNDFINEVPLARRKRQVNGELGYYLKSHMVSGFVRSSDFKDEEVLDTFNEDTGIRINIYRVPQTILTANCARMTSTNTYASNGIVHKVDRVMKPVKDTVADIIAKSNDFTIFKKLMSSARLLPILRDPSSHVTVFAPTDNAFRNSGVNIEQLESSGCIDAMLKNHILVNVICSTAINRRVRSENLLGKRLKLERNAEDQKLYIDGNIQVTAKDLMGTNGVVHIIDGVAVPSEAKSFFNTLKTNTYDTLVNAVNETDIFSTLQGEKSSFLVPNKKAFEEFIRQEENKRKLKDTLLFHSIKTDKSMRLMKNNELVPTHSGKNVRFNIYRDGFTNRLTAQCVPVLSESMDVCQGSLQAIGGVMKPSEGRLLNVLEANEKYSLFNQIIKKANLSETLNADGPFTILAPTSETLRKSLRDEELNSYVEDYDKARKFASKYILPEMLCCTGVKSNLFNFFLHGVRTIGNDLLSMSRDSRTDEPKIGRARITECDRVADNGVIHEIDIPVRSKTTICLFGCPF